MRKVCRVCGKLEQHKSWNSSTCEACLQVGIKRCGECGKVLLISEFALKAGKPSGVCKQCNRLRCNEAHANRYNSDEEYRHKIIAQSSAQHKERYANDYEYRQRCNEANAVWRRERYNADDAYRVRVRTYHHDRRVGIDGDLTSNDWNDALVAFDFTCAYCGSERGLSMEHIVPVSAGGRTDADNIISACKSCNSSKNNKEMISWFTSQPFYSKERLENIIKYIKSKGNA